MKYEIIHARLYLNPNPASSIITVKKAYKTALTVVFTGKDRGNHNADSQYYDDTVCNHTHWLL